MVSSRVRKRVLQLQQWDKPETDAIYFETMILQCRSTAAQEETQRVESKKRATQRARSQAVPREASSATRSALRRNDCSLSVVRKARFEIRITGCEPQGTSGILRERNSNC